MSNVSLADHRKQKTSACPEAEIRSKSIRATRLIGGPRPLKGKTAEGLKTGELVESLQDFYPQTLSLIPVKNWTFNQGNLWTWELSGQGSKLKTEGVNKTTVHSEAAQHHLCPREMVIKIPLQRNEPKLKNYRY